MKRKREIENIIIIGFKNRYYYVKYLLWAAIRPANMQLKPVMDSCIMENAIKPQSLTGTGDLDQSDVFKHYLNGREEAIQDADGQAEGLWIELQLGMHIPQPPDSLITLFRGNICILKNEKHTQNNPYCQIQIKSVL